MNSESTNYLQGEAPVGHFAATTTLGDMWVVCSDGLVLQHFKLRV
jgi:hypothetical protein